MSKDIFKLRKLGTGKFNVLDDKKTIECYSVYQILINKDLSDESNDSVFSIKDDNTFSEIVYKLMKKAGLDCKKDLTFVIKSVARCNDGDNYSEEVGKKISLVKNESIAYERLRNVISEFQDYFDDLSFRLTNLSSKIENILISESNYLSELA